MDQRPSMAFVWHNPKVPVRMYYIFSVVCLALAALTLFSFPASVDDWWYLAEFDFFKGYSSLKAAFNAKIEIIRLHYLFDNVRLANIFGVFLIDCPLWVWGLIRFGATWFLCHMILKLGGVGRGQVVPLIWAVFLIVFSITWEHGYISWMYFCNYILSGCLLLWTINVFLTGTKSIAGGFLLGMLVGACHESFGLAFFGGCTICFIFHRQLATRGNIAAFIGCIGGLAWLIASPAWASYHGTMTDAPMGRLYYLTHLWAVVIFAVVWLVFFLKKSTRSFALSPILLFAIASMPLIFVACMGARTRAALPCCLLSIIGFMVMGKRMIPASFVRGKLCGILSAAAACVVVVHLALVGYYSLTIHRQINDLVQKCRVIASAGERCAFPFQDVLQPWDTNPLALRRPEAHLLRDFHWAISRLADWCEVDVLFPVPSVLENFSPEKATAVPSMPGFYFYRGHIVGPADLPSGFTSATVSYGGYKEEKTALIIPFTTAKGQNYSYIFVDRSIIACFFASPNDVKIVNFPTEPPQKWTELPAIVFSRQNNN